jgi:hypothetical protein
MYLPPEILQAPKVYITPDALARINAYGEFRPHEVKGYCWVRQIGNDFLIHEPVVLRQHVSQVHATVLAEDRGAYAHQAIMRGRNPQRDLCCEWHWHRYDPTPSPTDEANIALNRGDVLITIVFSQMLDEEYCRLDLRGGPVPVSLRVPLRTWVEPLPPEVQEEIDADVAAKVNIEQPRLRDRMGIRS